MKLILSEASEQLRPARKARVAAMADYDVIVIGGGAAGMSAAITAHDRGARVLLFDGATELGGSTALSGGWFFAAGTSVSHSAKFPRSA